MRSDITSIVPLRHSAFILLCATVLLAPAFLFGAGGTDLHCQSLWVRFFTEQFWHGDIYPRWLEAMFAGNGSPVFFYYPPFAYYTAALFAFLAPLDAFGYYPIAASALCAVILSGFSFYVWMREENADAGAALMGSLLYMAAPSHMAQDFYHSLLFSSVWAYAWVPLLLMFAKKIALKQAYCGVGFAFSLGLLIMTNLPITIIFGPLAIGYSLFYFGKGRGVTQTLRLALATLLGVGLAATLLLPAFIYRHAANIDVQWLMTGENSYEKSYFFMGFDQTDSNLFTLYWAVSSLLLFIYYHAAPPSRLRSFFSVASIVALVLMIPITHAVWDAILPLKMLQMAERLFIVPTVTLAILTVIALPRLRVFSWGLVVVSIAITGIVGWQSHTTVETFQKNDAARYKSYLLHIDQYANYLTSRNLTPEFGTQEGIADLKRHLKEVTVTSGDAVVEVKQWQPRHILLAYHATQPSTLQVRQFDFPGFNAFLDNHELDIRRDETTGQILFDVPAGSGDITLELMQLLPENVGNLVSLLSSAILMLWVLVEMRGRKK